jgi:dihydroflavonol-4-reductase
MAREEGMEETVLVTGVSGFIARQVALDLLNAGYHVRGTVRDASRSESVRETLARAGGDVSKLEFVEADLDSDTGWEEAVRGTRFVQHIASPFPIEQPRDREALVPAARSGALRVLSAARDARVERVVLTSSVAAMEYRPRRPREFTVREDDWTDPEWRRLSPYIVSKTRAEKSAWSWAVEHGWRDRLTVVNPGFVLGPTLDARIGTSLEVIKLFLDGAYPATPNVCFTVADVRDISAVHLRAMEQAELGGRRLIAAGQTLSLPEMGEILREAFPAFGTRIPKRVLPDLFVRLLAVFDRSLRSVTPNLGHVGRAESAYVTELTGVSFRPSADAVRDAARSMIEHGVVTPPA